MMKNRIIDIIHDISTEKPSIYTGLFGYENYDIAKYKNFNFAFKLEQDGDENELYNNIMHMLTLIIITVLTESNLPRYDNQLTNYDGKTYNIKTTDNAGFNLSNLYHYYDIENIIDDMSIDITDNSFVTIKLKLPIYNYSM
jgi:hypothetical protein